MELRGRRRPNSVLVIGGINADITAAAEIELGTSNPGRVSLSPGGVARNIAHDLALMGVPVSLCGVMGTDPLSTWVLERTREAGVATAGIDRRSDVTPSSYVSVLSDGELTAAVSDMTATDSMTAEHAITLLERARVSPAFLVADANLPAPALGAALEWAADRGAVTVVEPVSEAKVRRLASVRAPIGIVTPNAGEARVLARTEVPASIGRWVVTLGERGAATWAAGESCARLMYTSSVPTRNANGAGDAFVAGLVAALAAGAAIERSVRFGMVAGRAAAESEHSVPDRLPSFRMEGDT